MDRKQMEAVINGGGSVLHEGKLHTSISTLPSKDALAKTDEEKAASADELDAQIEELQKRRDALGNRKTEQKQPRTFPIPEADREQARKELGKFNREKLLIEVEETRKAGFTVEFADDANKGVIIEAILNAQKAE